jgi:hypothetical protein
MRRSAAFHSSRTVKFALVPAVGLAVFAFANPAHAGDTIVDPPPLPTEETSFATDVVVVRDPVVASTAIEPAGDGSAVAVATVIEPPAPAPAAVEMPANKAVAIEADPSPGATDPAPSAVIPPADVTPQADPPVPAAQPPARQYHAPPEQYQPAHAVGRQTPRIRPERREPKVHSKPRATAPRVPHEASKLVQIVSRICADIDPGNLISPVENETANSDWNIGQIAGCIVDLIGDQVPLEGVVAPSPCSPGAQYQPEGGQYQTDVGVCAPSSPIPAVSVSPGSAGGPELGASIPAFPASPISPPVVEAATLPAPRVASGRAPKPRAVRPAHKARADHVLAVTGEHASPPSNDVFRPRPRVREAAEQRSAHAAVLRISGPRTRVEALRAQPERVASDAPAGSGTSAWLVAAAMLLLFGLASLASAMVGTVATNRPVGLRQLGLRVSSKGLSKHPLGRDARGGRGIRYRD